MVLGDATILQEERGGVGRADAELLLEAHEFQARCLGGHDEGLDAAPACALVDGGPDDDEAALDLGSAFARGAEDLGAVQHPLLGRFVELRGALDCGRIRTGSRFGDRHCAPDRLSVLTELGEELGALLGRAGRAYRRAAERRCRHAEVQAAVSPAEFFRLNADGDEAVVAFRQVRRGSGTPRLPPEFHPLGGHASADPPAQQGS